MGKRLPAALVAVACAATVAATPASAQDRDGGLQVAPDSPSGREYAVPLDQARRQGSRTPSRSRGADPAPAFGEGIRSPDRPQPPSQSDDRDRGGAAAPGGGPSGGGGSSSSGRSPSRDADPGVPGATAQRGRPAVNRAERTSADTGSGQVLAIVGVGGGVLLLGAAAGVLVRRRRPAPPPDAA